MKKHVTILLLLVAAIFVLAACGNNEPDTPTEPAQTQAETPPAANETPVVPEAVAVEDLPTVPTVDFDDMEPVELTIHYIFDSQVWQDDWRVWTQMAEHTGVHLVGTADPVNLNAGEAFTMQATLGFPADIYAGTLAPRFIEFGQQGAFIPLNDLIPTYAPYFYNLMQRFPEIRSAITAPDGNIYHMPGLNGIFDAELFPVSQVYWIRQDWLDILELDTPDTIEELEYVLTRFRDDMPAITGNDWVAPFFHNGANGGIRHLAGFWGARGNRIVGPSLADPNVLVHYWVQPEFMTAIENISRWFQEGLIDPEFFTRGGMNRQELFSTNQGGFLYHFPMSTGDFNVLMADEVPGFNLVPMIPPTNTLGTRWSDDQRGAMSGNGWALTPHNPYPERTLQMIDFMYHGHGRNLNNFGPYGITWEYDADGEPQFLPYVRQEGLTVLQVLRQGNGAVGANPYMADIRYELRAGTDWTRMAQAMYEAPAGYPPGFATPRLPAMIFSADDQLIVNDINAQLNAFLDETIHGFILNDWREIAGQWDAFVAQAEALGIRELEDIWQARYDLFRQRGF